MARVLRSQVSGPRFWARWLGTALALVAGALGRVAPAAAQGCAMCQTALGGPDDPLAKAMNVSILFLMAMPFALASVVGGWFLYMHWRARDARRMLHVVRAMKEGRL